MFYFMEKAILEQLVQLSAQIGELKSEMKQGFKEQNTKIEALHVEMNERFQEQDAKFEKRFQEQDASDIIIGFYHELNNKIHTSYNKLKNVN